MLEVFGKPTTLCAKDNVCCRMKMDVYVPKTMYVAE